MCLEVPPKLQWEPPHPSSSSVILILADCPLVICHLSFITIPVPSIISLPSMGFLLLSVKYPTEEFREAFFRVAGSEFLKQTSPLHQPLPASTSTEEWRVVVKQIEQHCDASILDQVMIRPLKPNDDNYAAFVGPQWQAFDVPADKVPPQIAAMIGRSEEDPTPHYDKCAQCTQSASQQCTRCKIVKYCTRDCQRRHWKACHKASCEQAREISLRQALTTNDGFLVSPVECQALSQGLKQSASSSGVVRCIAEYLERASQLDGCFVL